MKTSISASLLATCLLGIALCGVCVPARASDGSTQVSGSPEMIIDGIRLAQTGLNHITPMFGPQVQLAALDAYAIHSDDGLTHASRPPETTIGGIRLGQTQLNDIIRMYGPQVEKAVLDAYGFNGLSDDHVWIKQCVILRVGALLAGQHADFVMLLLLPDGRCTYEDIGKGPIAQTGHGLRLGDDRAAWNRIYGNQLGFASESPKRRGGAFGPGGILEAFGRGTGGMWEKRDATCDRFIRKEPGGRCYRIGMLYAKFDAAGKIKAISMEETMSDGPWATKVDQ